MAELLTFAYDAQTDQGEPLSGTIQATDGDEARTKIEAMGLRLLDLAPAQTAVRKPRAIRGDDLIVFNQHLAQLTKAGMPIEQGLRLIAQDTRQGRLRNSINSVAEELERGTPLAQAFEAHRGQFPPLYGRLVDAGVRSNNLPAMLVNLGRHYELIHRLRAQLWQAVTYPAMVLFFLMLLTLLFGIVVAPQFDLFLKETEIPIPPFTRMLMWLGFKSPMIVVVIGALLASCFIFWFIARMAHFDQWFIQTFIVPLPMIGKLLKYSAVSRWCDALYLGVQAGLPLPEAVELAGDAVDWKSLRRDGRVLVENITQGNAVIVRGQENRPVLPLSVRTAISFAHDRQNLPDALHSLSTMYQQLAEMRLAALLAMCLPLSMLLVGGLIFFVILGLFMPLLKFISNLTSAI